VGKMLSIKEIKSETIGQDFEIKGWSKITPNEKIKKAYFKLLKTAQTFFEDENLDKSELVNPHGLVIPGFLTYPGGEMVIFMTRH
jgi:hypothetical protein